LINFKVYINSQDKATAPPIGISISSVGLLPNTDSDIPSVLACSLSVGEWVLVTYDKSTFPGEVKGTGIEDDKVKVSRMVPSGRRYFKWPTVEDTIFYKMENVLRKLKAPTNSEVFAWNI